MNLRIAFIAGRRFEFQVPQSTPWAESARFAIEEGWDAAIQNARNFRPDVTFFFDPFSLPEQPLDPIPGVKVGIVATQPNQAELIELLRRQRTGATALDWYTWFEEPPSMANDLPLLGVVGALVDAPRFTALPFSRAAAVGIPQWAQPPDLQTSVKPLPLSTDPSKLREALSRCTILLYHSQDRLRLSDPAIVLALGYGQLLISNQSFPAECGVEEEDDYLVRPVKEWPAIIETEQAGLELFRAVRIRASQKVRELFDASSVFERLAQDAQLLSGPGRTSPARRRW